MGAPIIGNRIIVNNYNSPWYRYTGTVVEETEAGRFIVEFPGNSLAPPRRAEISGMDFYLSTRDGHYETRR